MNIPLSRPDITQKEIDLVADVLKTPYLSTGPRVKEFENIFASFVGAKYAVAVSSGTAGLHLSIKCAGISDDDEVITTPFSFIASANCILFERGKPVFVDADENSLNIDVKKIEGKITEKTKAILVVHAFGIPSDMDSVNQLAKKYSLKVIEDACEALGAKYYSNLSGLLGCATPSAGNWKNAGTMSNSSVFAFYPNKQITTAEGGMIVTDDGKIASLCRSLRNQGRDENGGWLSHIRLGYNYRLSDIQCALGIAQLERIEEILSKREEAALLYKKYLEKVDEIILPFDEPSYKRSWFVYVVRLKRKFSEEKRDKILEYLKRKGIGCNKYFPCIHLQPFYRETFGYKKGDFPVAEEVSERVIALPFFTGITEKQISYTVEALKQAIIEA